MSAVVVERAGGECEQDERDGELVLRLWPDLTFGVHGELCFRRAVCAFQRGAHGLGFVAWELDLAEAELELAGAGKLACGACLGDLAGEQRALRDGDRAVRVEDGLGDGGADLLSRL